MGLGGLGTKGLGLGLDNWLRSSVRLYKYNWWCSPSTCWTTPSSLKKRGKWATGLLGMTFIDPYCNTGSFINEVMSYSKLCYFGPLWPTLTYSDLLWPTLGYSVLLRAALTQSVRKRKAFSYLKSGPSLSLCLIWQFPEVMAFRVKKKVLHQEKGKDKQKRFK